MSQFDFTSIIDRHGKDALAVDGIGANHWGMEPTHAQEGFDEIPLWVADMNFATAPAVSKALAARIEHPLYGYFLPPDSYYQAIQNWQLQHHGVEVPREAIGYENGVHGLICTCLNLFTQPGESVFVHTPAYVGFLADLNQLGRKAATSELVQDADGVWRMDFDNMEQVLEKSGAKLAIFCSPHNPCGRVWEAWELERAMEIFAAHDCLVISDEIWSDLVFLGHKHIPTASVSDDARMRTISAYAPSKTFNLAGLVGSYHLIYNPTLRQKICHYSEATHYNEPNVLSVHALMGAFSEQGDAWRRELVEVLEDNCRWGADFIERELQGCSTTHPQGTYMLLLNCEEYCKQTGKTLDDILQAGWDKGVAYQDGRQFKAPWSIRINCALPKARLQTAFERMKEYVFV